MFSSRTGEEVNALPPVPYEVLVRVNRQLVVEKVELLEELRQLRAAVNIYRELAVKKRDRGAA